MFCNVLCGWRVTHWKYKNVLLFVLWRILLSAFEVDHVQEHLKTCQCVSNKSLVIKIKKNIILLLQD